jgi:hypothetical protein
MVSENEGTASPDLAAVVAQMPFAAALVVVVDAAAAGGAGHPGAGGARR